MPITQGLAENTTSQATVTDRTAPGGAKLTIDRSVQSLLQETNTLLKKILTALLLVNDIEEADLELEEGTEE